MEEKICEDKVDGSLERTINNLRELWEAYCEGEEEVEDLGCIHDYGLSFDYVEAGTFTDQESGYFRYQLSWGGPSTEFRFYTDASKRPYKIEYWYLDWFDGACRVLSGEDRQLMVEIFDWFAECGSVDYVLEQALEA